MNQFLWILYFLLLKKTRSLIKFFLSSFLSNHSFKPYRYVDTVMPREGYVERLLELLELESMELILFSMSLQCKQKGVTKEQLLHMRLIVNKNQLWIGKQSEIFFSHLSSPDFTCHVSVLFALSVILCYFFLPINLIIEAVTKVSLLMT